MGGRSAAQKAKIEATIERREALRAVNFGSTTAWPLTSPDYDGSVDLLTYLWREDRPYSIQDLTTMASARFELSRKRKIPSHHLRLLQRIDRNWKLRLAARARDGGLNAEPDVTAFTPQLVAPTDAQFAQLVELDAEQAGVGRHNGPTFPVVQDDGVGE